MIQPYPVMQLWFVKCLLISILAVLATCYTENFAGAVPAISAKVINSPDGLKKGSEVIFDLENYWRSNLVTGVSVSDGVATIGIPDFSIGIVLVIE